MYVKSTRTSAKREVQKERSVKRDVQKFRSAQRDDRALRSAKRDDQIARPRRAQTCEQGELRARRAMRMCPRCGQIFLFLFLLNSRASPAVSFHMSLIAKPAIFFQSAISLVIKAQIIHIKGFPIRVICFETEKKH